MIGFPQCHHSPFRAVYYPPFSTIIYDMSWFKRTKAGILTDLKEKNETPDGYWVNCPSCKHIANRRELTDNRWVCTACNHHFRMNSLGYFRLLFDKEEFTLHDTQVEAVDPLGFADKKTYAKRLTDAQRKTGMTDAVRAATGTVGGHRISVAAQDFSFIGGSMNSVVGEVITRAIVRAYEEKIPLLIISQSGGARMMEGAYSLMQLAKTSAHLARYAKTGLPFFSLMTDPTTGGVTASFAMLGDFNLAEPGALIGFAGPRVIRETIGQDLPDGFQRAEFLLEKGFIDRIVPRKELRSTLTELLDLVLEEN